MTICEPAAHVVAGGFNQIIVLPGPTQNDIDVTVIGGGVVTFVAACEGTTKYNVRHAKADIKTMNGFRMLAHYCLMITLKFVLTLVARN